MVREDTRAPARQLALARCVSIGWRLRSEGLKHWTGTALVGEDGRLRGRSLQLWIEPRG